MEPRVQPGRPRDVIFRRRSLLPSEAGDPRAAAVAFVVQLAVLALLTQFVIVPVAFDLLRDDQGRLVEPERIGFLTLPRAPAPVVEAPRRGGDGRPDIGATSAPTPPLVAPTQVPTGITAPGPAKEANAGGSGPLVGGGGPLRGIQPSFTDRRLWAPEGVEVVAPVVPLTRADTLNGLLRERAMVYLDSLARLDPGGRRPGDWTFEKNGKKYGVDGAFIRLGDFKIPTALLAAMPMNVQANPVGLERARRLDAMRSDIQYHAARAMRDDEFRQAVKAIRERKERERQEAEARKREGEPTRP